jgi:hypothetical protein
MEAPETLLQPYNPMEASGLQSNPLSLEIPGMQDPVLGLRVFPHILYKPEVFKSTLSPRYGEQWWVNSGGQIAQSFPIYHYHYHRSTPAPSWPISLPCSQFQECRGVSLLLDGQVFWFSSISRIPILK